MAVEPRQRLCIVFEDFREGLLGTAALPSDVVAVGTLLCALLVADLSRGTPPTTSPFSAGTSDDDGQDLSFLDLFGNRARVQNAHTV